MGDYLPEGQHCHNIPHLGPEIILITPDYFMSILHLSSAEMYLETQIELITKIGAVQIGAKHNMA